MTPKEFVSDLPGPVEGPLHLACTEILVQAPSVGLNTYGGIAADLDERECGQRLDSFYKGRGSQEAVAIGKEDFLN